MSENLPKKYKEKFFSKFINKLKMFFSRTKEETVISNDKTVKGDKNNKKDMINNLKVDIDMNINTEYEKKTFM